MNDCAELLLKTASKSLKLPDDRIEKAIATIKQDPVSSSLLESFLTGSEPHALFVAPTVSDSMVLSRKYPTLPPSKLTAVVFLRTQRTDPITVETFNSGVFYSQITNDPCETVLSLCRDVFLPAAIRGDPTLEIPEYFRRVNVEQVENVMTEATIELGKSRKRTLLPLPPCGSLTSEAFELMGISDSDRVHALEKSVVGWTRQISDRISEEPEAIHSSSKRAYAVDEVRFWELRSIDLAGILTQLSTPAFQQAMEVLSGADSVYVSPFKKLGVDVESAASEASDNARFLQTISTVAKRMNSESIDYTSLPELFDPILHISLLVWKHSKYYNSPARLAVLLRLFCNGIIYQSERFLTGQQIFQLLNNEEASEALQRIGRIILTCTLFRDKYELFKDISEQQERAGGGWRIHPTAVFETLTRFKDHCIDLFEFVKTIIQYARLEKLEIGGTRGADLSRTVQELLSKFKDAVSLFQSVPNDVMTLENSSFEQFNTDYTRFSTLVKELDKRLSLIISRAFTDLDSITQKLKLLDSLDGLWDRPLLAIELDKQFASLLTDYKADLRSIHKQYLDGRASVGTHSPDAPVYRNQPPVSAAVSWARSLKARVREPLAKIRVFGRIVTDRNEELKEIEKLQESISIILDEFEQQMFVSWEDEAIAIANERLGSPLLARDGETLSVNFDPSVQRVIKEVKYLTFLGFQVPEVTMSLFERSETYRKWNGELDGIISQYNGIMRNMLPVERPLLLDRVSLIDKGLSAGIDGTILWRDMEKIQAFIDQSRSVVQAVNSVVGIMKTNLSRIMATSTRWADAPMIERKNKPLAPDEFDANQKAQMGLRLVQTAEDAKDIHRLVRESNEAVRVSKQSANWRAYLDFISQIVAEGFGNAVIASLEYLGELLDHKNDNYVRGIKSPMLEVQTVLMDEEVSHDPPMRRTAGSTYLVSVREMIDNWTREFLSIATVMHRLDTGNGDYLSEVQSNPSIRSITAHLTALIDATESEVNSHRASFSKFSVLWTEDAEDSLQSFLSDRALYAKMAPLSVEFDKTSAISWKEVIQIIGLDLGPEIPALEHFEAQLKRLVELRAEVGQITSPADVGWFRINSHPFKQSLIQSVNHREKLLIDFLDRYVSDRISSLDQVMKRIAQGLNAGKGPDGTIEQELYQVMTNIKDVKLASEAVKLLFSPFRDMVQTLKKYDRNVSDDLVQILDQAPSRWTGLVRQGLDERERILPLQNAELDKIRVNIDSFQSEIVSFRSGFLAQCPFAPGGDVEDAMGIIDQFVESTGALVARSKELNNLELLFDLSLSTYGDLRVCQEELRLLRQVWDYVGLVESKFNEWKSMLWDKIETDDLSLAVKDMITYIRGMPKEIKSWKIYAWLSDQVKNMSTVLPLVSELHSDTMRDRHWKQVMLVTGMSFQKGPDFSFKDVLNLGLHRFPDDVSEIVAQSGKEFKIEKKLNQIKSIWTKMEVEFDRSRSDQLPLLTNLVTVIETLESHSLDIMGMVGQGRFIEFCKADVDEWSFKLRTIDSVLNVWQKVMRNWSRLEPIFLLSDDIRAQLPDDSKRFEAVDKEWKDLMVSVGQHTSLVEICCGTEGRESQLTKINVSIETCEKALNDYLEQKKKVFPRFYFVANQALLDILSNGNNPRKVAEYIGDCFDGIKALDFDPDDPAGKTIKGIWSKDTEYVAFSEKLELTGPVEQYLCKLESHVRNQLREILEDAKASADNWEVDKPRELWLQDYCAQLALVATQIVWTEETDRAFEELEAGSDSVMKDYKRICDDRIEKLIKQVQQPLSKDLRNKIITIITIDVHARDVIEKFVQQKLSDSSAFQWQSQLRFHWIQNPTGSNLVSFTQPADAKTCLVKICDWQSIYAYEYVGNCGRLVITPLTDRCYLTLTQALNLVMGSAPAGPAGTGKTETTKDLSRAIGLPIVVFNCSDQMSYLTMAQICKGLASSGAWGCFDEFNRISIEVLSVVTTQVKSVLDAIKEDVLKFLFMDDEIKLVKTCGFFITMNPGYAGRTELPESLKSLFRSCAMCVPDLTFICENMLLSEGFLQSRQLARKFVCLYSLCKELLSAQAHYDWGLRAVKSLLRQAGTLKRAAPDMNEYAILMRALRDFNTPKIVTEDLPIFLRLISDLFPGVSAETKSAAEVERVVREITISKGLQPDSGFVNKVVGLLDILNVRHCCFIIGPPGSAKTMVWKVLMDSLRAMGEDGLYETLNPKAISSDELYGIMTKTKEWKDGAISVIMRNMSKEINGYKSSHHHKWIILDGDIDAKWIESMNTVMDDNKVLTLVSNERIPFTPSMRMILEVQDMLHASPATVSRGGVLFINETDVGWKPIVESWRDRFTSNPIAPLVFQQLFTNLFESRIDDIRKTFMFSCPILDVGFVQSIMCFIDALVLSASKEVAEFLRSASADQQKLVYESYFVYAFMWSVGGAIANDKSVNHRRNFNTWLKQNISSITKVKFPESGDPMDYRFDVMSMSWVSWESAVSPYNPLQSSEQRLFSKIVISNVDLERSKFNLGLHVRMGKPVLMCGTSGTGKTTIVHDFLRDLAISKGETYSSAVINLNSYTDSLSLQRMMESNLDKRTGRTFGPPGNKKCLFFIDDLNMPYVDEYDTQSAAMLLFQLMSHKSVFDRAHLEERKDITDIDFVACMNPKAGSFMVNGRLQRHFTVQTAHQPSAELITQVYSQILGNHLQAFDPNVQGLLNPILNATIDTLSGICDNSIFLPSAKRFTYNFNLRDVSRVVQGMLCSNPSIFRGAAGAVRFGRLWMHESQRVFSDRLVEKSDIEKFSRILQGNAKKHFAATSVSMDELLAGDLIYTSFVSSHGGNEKQYMQIKDMQSLRKVLEEKLSEYNESFAEMNLVLFDAAIEHIARICRIIDSPSGHALLVGVGGSGKQSLARLACFIMKVNVVSIMVNQNYGMTELRTDLQEFYRKAAVKPGTPHALLLTDNQIADERFLIYMNDILSGGQIPDLFSREEMDSVLGNLRSAAKAAGVADERNAMIDFFYQRVQRNLHVIICHSPVGDTLRVRARKFPALISGTSIDVFHPWAKEALVNVASKFLGEAELLPSELIDKIAGHIAHVHLSIDDANARFLASEGRYNYTTPKSFLELIAFYRKLFVAKRKEMEAGIERLEKGLLIMSEVKSKVEGLQKDLAIKMIEVEEKKTATTLLIEQVTVASEKAAAEKAIADSEADKTNALAQEASAIKAQADAELEEALPAMQAAKDAVNCLTKPAIQELKSLGKPPQECTEVTKAVLILLKNEKKNLDWKSAQRMMNNPGQFLEEVAQFNADNIPDWVLEFVAPVIAQPFFNYETMKGKSTAAAYLTNWVVNIIGYNKIYKKVAPLMAKVKEATAAQQAAEAQLAIVLARVREVQEKVATLQKTLADAVLEKEQTEAEAARCVSKLDLAKRLVDGLSDENVRWTATVNDMKSRGTSLVGDTLMASAFVGYISPFSASFRSNLWQQAWLKDMKDRGIPLTEKMDPLSILANDSDIATWKNEGLPADRMSIENASVITSCARWPLLIDPQLQGATWLKKRLGEDLTVIQLTQPGWLTKVSKCIQAGSKLLIESIGEEIDAGLEPLLSRSIIRRGRNAWVIKLDGEEIEYDCKFQLWLQTKLPNPHYRPEIAAQCTIVNFIVTPDGLEDQILAMVVNAEKPELEQEKQSLVRKQNEFKVTLAQLEDELLAQLSAADPSTILDNFALVDGLETTKKTAIEIQHQSLLAKETETTINALREKYRSVAQESSMLFFLIIQLSSIEHMYQYSLDSFVGFLYRAIERTAVDAEESVESRSARLVSSVRTTIFKWVNRGLFERHKLILSSLLTFKLLQRGLLKEEFDRAVFDYLLVGGLGGSNIQDNPVNDWLPNQYWSAVKSLSCVSGFELLAQNLSVDAPGRFKEWFNDQSPEESKLPLDWKRLDSTNPLQKLLVLKALRPDRLTVGLSNWISRSLPDGKASFTECDSSMSFYDILSAAYDDSDSVTPIFFILSPGADPVTEVERLGRKVIGLQANVNYHIVAMGQGQDTIAMAKLELAHKEGHWVMLQNIHLMPRWCVELEKKLDAFTLEGSHANFRCFLSADPSVGIPIGILNRSIKLTNEPPQGLNANLKRAFASFSKEVFEEKDSKVKVILYALCHFYSVILERKKFGPLGFNMSYPFNIGDLRDSALILYNYMENSNSSKVPWDDLKYLIGDVVIGGHVVDDLDRRLVKSYLDFWLHDGLLDETELVPYSDKLSVKSPFSTGHEKFIEFIDQFPNETPVMFGLHSNAEIGFRTTQSESILSMLRRLYVGQQTVMSVPDATESGKQQSKEEQLCGEIIETISDIRFPTEEIAKQLSDDEKGPYQYVFLQECDCMNHLVSVMQRSLKELQLGFKGELTMSESMEQLSACLVLDQIPPRWQKASFPSNRGLMSWLRNLKERCVQLDEWTNDPTRVPKVVDLSKLFNPQSFLTAIKQTCCQQQKLELDKLTVITEVTKKERNQIDAPARDGAYVTGLYLEGARWDISTNSLEESRPKELFCPMPVIHCRAVLEEEVRDMKNVYQCPTYAIAKRRPYFVFSAQLRTKAPPAKWVMAGVAMILDIGK